jgi:predicted ArsR family transcriptional regulator
LLLDLAADPVRGREEEKVPQSEWGDRFLATTRGRIIGLLRRAPRTVNELASDLELTDNAIRAHLATLERDGLVQQSGTRPGFRKPNLTYELTAGAGQLYPKPYDANLQKNLSYLARRHSTGELEEVLREVGRRLATGFASEVRAAGLRERVAEVVRVLGELGGLAEIEEAEGRLVIRGFDCPLAAAVMGHRAGCRLAETLLSELLGVPVQERCDHEGPPRCCFEVKLS